MQLLSCLAPGIPASLFEALADLLDAELSLDATRSGPDSMDDPFRDGRADLGWICSTSFAALGTGADPSVRLVGVGWVPEDPDAAGRSVYFSDLVVPADSPIRSVDDLDGARVGGNDEISLSGHHALRIELARRGHDPDGFADIVLTGAHHRSLDQVTGGRLDAAIVDSLVRTARSRHDPAVAGLRVVERLGPWPTQPLVARADLDDGTVAAVRRALLASDGDPTVRAELDRAAIDCFVPVGADHCDPVVRALARV
ncbi:MAG: PhnD/SsuA/transferrin family substrate-binding protein [Actinomycetota bacterium]